MPLRKLPLAMRHTKPGPSCTVPMVLKPTACSACRPLVGAAAQPRTVGPPQWPKSTATVTPLLAVHVAAAAAGCVAAAVTPNPPQTSANTASSRAIIGAVGALPAGGGGRQP